MQRRAIEIRGIVQGVGFRPFVHALCARLGLDGFVRNRSGAVEIEAEGAPAVLDELLAKLANSHPPLARIERMTWQPLPPLGQRGFRIEASESDASGAVFISPDVATCDDCLAELLDPLDRRHGYPFLNCTNCGPRLTIITGAPYDRPSTTMAGFPMCPACRREYENPADRRFHAQPTCCGDCGPRLALLDGDGAPIVTENPLQEVARALREGKVAAIKGLGGYHLACDATSEAAVRRLRQRKHREEKPLAVMVPSIEAAEVLCEVGATERALLTSSRRPIVLLRRRMASGVAEAVAPGNPYLGLMLPYTPLHHLLLRKIDGLPLVMTSGNRSDEPIAYEDEAAIERLGGIADLFLVHDRPIHVRCDDSVTRVLDGQELPVRRSRGYAPVPVTLPLECPVPILAAGGQLKATFALGRDGYGFLSHHLGDLDHFEAYRAFERDAELYEQLFEIRPAVIVHDRHPDYASTRYAQRRAAEAGLGLVAVQHHHAHMAACMAEHGLQGPMIGVAFDGAGLGTDGTIWGGEFLVGDYREFRRAAHLRCVGMPGGEQAVRQPWRMALSHLLDAGCEPALLYGRVPPASLKTAAQMLHRRFNAPWTSSAGRLFDAVASLAGVRDRVSYEGQAAVELEAMAAGVDPDGTYPFELEEVSGPDDPEPRLVIDTRPLIRAVAAEAADGFDQALIARRFHATLAEVILAVCGRLRAATGIETVVLSGGVFMNALLSSEACRRLEAAGFAVHRHRLFPPNDGGLSLGQLAVACSLLVSERPVTA